MRPRLTRSASIAARSDEQMIPTIVLRQARAGFGLPHGHVRLLSTRFGKVCLAHTARDGRRTQLRLVRADAGTRDRLESEMAWLSHLATHHDLAVPIPRRWHGGRCVSGPLAGRGSNTWFAVACSWVPGRHLNLGLRANHMRRAGNLLARMHSANQDAPPGIAIGRADWGIPRLFALATTLRDLCNGTVAPPSGVSDAAATALRASHERLIGAWRTLPVGNEHVGLIHTDSHWQNLRWTRSSVGLVDFEDLANGRYLLDIACLWARVEARSGAHGLLDAIMEGYDCIRPLSPLAPRDLQVMLAFRRFDYAGWVLSWPRLDQQSWGPAFVAGTPAYMDRWLTR